MEKFGCPKLNFGPPHWQVESLAYSILFTAFYFICAKGPRKPWKELGSQSLANYIIRVQTRNLWIQS